MRAQEDKKQQNLIRGCASYRLKRAAVANLLAMLHTALHHHRNQ
jgi:hypothetical protein